MKTLAEDLSGHLLSLKSNEFSIWRSTGILCFQNSNAFLDTIIPVFFWVTKFPDPNSESTLVCQSRLSEAIGLANLRCRNSRQKQCIQQMCWCGPNTLTTRERKESRRERERERAGWGADRTWLPWKSSKCTVPSCVPRAMMRSATVRQEAASEESNEGTLPPSLWYLSRGSSSSPSSSSSSSSLDKESSSSPNSSSPSPPSCKGLEGLAAGTGDIDEKESTRAGSAAPVDSGSAIATRLSLLPNSQ